MNKRVEKIRNDFETLKNKIDPKRYNEGTNECIHSWFYFFDAALKNIDMEIYEISFIVLVSIAEGIAKEVYGGYLDFGSWITKNQNKLASSRVDKKEDDTSFLNRVWKDYNTEQGSTKNFVRIFIDMYKNKQRVPPFVFTNVVEDKEKGVKSYSYDSKTYKSEDIMFRFLEKELKEIYKVYRSNPLHQAVMFDKSKRFFCKIGYGTLPSDKFTPDDFSQMILSLLEYYLFREPLCSGN